MCVPTSYSNRQRQPLEARAPETRPDRLALGPTARRASKDGEHLTAPKREGESTVHRGRQHFACRRRISITRGAAAQSSAFDSHVSVAPQINGRRPGLLLRSLGAAKRKTPRDPPAHPPADPQQRQANPGKPRQNPGKTQAKHARTPSLPR